MDALYEAAVLYKPLLHRDYHIVAAYRQEQIRIKFIFLPEHFYHLVGFHKLLDLKALVQPRMLLHKVLSREITASVITRNIISSISQLVIIDRRSEARLC